MRRTPASPSSSSVSRQLVARYSLHAEQRANRSCWRSDLLFGVLEFGGGLQRILSGAGQNNLAHLRRQLRDRHRDVMFLHAQEPADADDGVQDSFVGRHDTALSEFPHFGLLTHWPSSTLAAEIDAAI